MKVAIIGMGYIGKVHFQVLKGIQDISEIVLVDENFDDVSRFAKNWNIDDVRCSVDDVITDPEIKVVHNCTPNHVHYELNKRLLLSGKHVLSEKPLCLTSEEAQELQTLAEEQDLVTGVNFCYRYYPAVQEIAHRIHKGQIGRIMAVDGHFFQDWLFHETDYSWRLEPRYSGISNALGDIGSHCCDLIQFVTDMKLTKLIADIDTVHPVRQKPTSAAATFSNSNEYATEDVHVELEDYASVLFRMENGASGSYRVGQVCAGHKVDINFKIFGSKGSISWSHTRPEQFVMGSRDREQQIFVENPLQQASEIASFARLPSGHPMGYHDAVHNLFSEFYHEIKNRQPIYRGCPNFQTGKKQVQIMEAAIESARSRSWTMVKD